MLLVLPAMLVNTTWSLAWQTLSHSPRKHDMPQMRGNLRERTRLQERPGHSAMDTGRACRSMVKPMEESLMVG